MGTSLAVQAGERIMVNMETNPRPMFKAQEKELYDDLTQLTPEDSYLRTVLAESRQFVFHNIDNDIAFPVWEYTKVISDSMKQSQAELKALNEKLNAEKKRLGEIQLQIKYAQNEFRDIVTATKRFVNASNEASALCNRALSSVE